MLKIFNKKLLFLLILVFLFSLVVIIQEINASTGCYEYISANHYKYCSINNGTSYSVNVQGCSYPCKKITNNTGATIFIPTKSCNEWYSFLNNLPSGVSKSDCCTSHSYSSCYDNDVYWYDSCSNREERYQDCSYCCSGSSCTGECSAGSTQSCSDSCSYKYCSGSSCVTGTKTDSGTRTCGSTCYWGSCNASASCPASTCSTNDNCGPPVVEIMNICEEVSCNTICSRNGKSCIGIRSFSMSGYEGHYYTPYDGCAGWTGVGNCNTIMHVTSGVCVGSFNDWCYCKCQ